MAEGTIKRLTDRGFGFIDLGDGKDMFFHMSNVEGAQFDDLNEGQKVSFTVGEGPKGPRATFARCPDAPRCPKRPKWGHGTAVPKPSATKRLRTKFSGFSRETHYIFRGRVALDTPSPSSDTGTGTVQDVADS